MRGELKTGIEPSTKTMLGVYLTSSLKHAAKPLHTVKRKLSQVYKISWGSHRLHKKCYEYYFGRGYENNENSYFEITINFRLKIVFNT